ncbi:MAG: adenosylmethionine--8-amino-7-oxononanoate transaminase [Proteobacteria bacterium]|nr:MAG: adenosylmethionine--8-amino-7-oxononanoate transaminase [Pseudomonadota bacterium]
MTHKPPSWFADPARHLWLPYTQMQTTPAPLPVAAMEGARLTLADGRVLIDGVANWWTAAHGAAHPHIVAAIQAQAATLPHVMLGGLIHEQALTLARRLAALLPGDLQHVFFVDSGSVAVEVAMKMALQYWIRHGKPDKRRFLAFRHGYHGDTAGAMAVSDPNDGMHALFKDHLTPQLFIDVPRGAAAYTAFDRFLDAHQDEIAAVIIEPLVQGAGGMRFHEPADLAAIAASTKRHGALLICDEIFTGFGRTGSLFAVNQASIIPDIICLGKALTGGAVTLAAAVARAPVFDAFLSDDPAHALMHGPTYMGNAIACAAANASLDLFEREPRLNEAKQIEAQLQRDLFPLRTLPGVVDVRVKGAIGVIEMARIANPAALRQRFVAEGVWLRPFGNIIYLTPALTIAPNELTTLTSAIARVAAAGDWGEGRSAETGA